MRQGLCQLQTSHGPYCVIKFLKLLSEVQIRIMNTHQGFWTILIKHCRIYDLPNLPAEYNSVCRVWICSGKICRARLSKTKEYLCDFVNVHHSPPPFPPPPLSTTDIGLATALIAEEQTILVQLIQRDGHLGFWGFLHPFDILQYFH